MGQGHLQAGTQPEGRVHRQPPVSPPPASPALRWPPGSWEPCFQGGVTADHEGAGRGATRDRVGVASPRFGRSRWTPRGQHATGQTTGTQCPISRCYGARMRIGAHVRAGRGLVPALQHGEESGPRLCRSSRRAHGCGSRRSTPGRSWPAIGAAQAEHPMSRPRSGDVAAYLITPGHARRRAGFQLRACLDANLATAEGMGPTALSCTSGAIGGLDSCGAAGHCQRFSRPSTQSVMSPRAREPMGPAAPAGETIETMRTALPDPAGDQPGPGTRWGGPSRSSPRSSTWPTATSAWQSVSTRTSVGVGNPVHDHRGRRRPDDLGGPDGRGLAACAACT